MAQYLSRRRTPVGEVVATALALPRLLEVPSMLYPDEPAPKVTNRGLHRIECVQVGDKWMLPQSHHQGAREIARRRRRNFNQRANS